MMLNIYINFYKLDYGLCYRLYTTEYEEAVCFLSYPLTPLKIDLLLFSHIYQSQ